MFFGSGQQNHKAFNSLFLQELFVNDMGKCDKPKSLKIFHVI